MASKKKILIIGGGFTGLGSVKSLKEEGFDPVVYEKTPHIGGTWFYRDETPIGFSSIMPTTVINHSKEMGTASNYVPDKSLPNYPRHQETLKMYYKIGEQFDCFKHFVCNREVLTVKRSADYDDTGRWDVKVKNTETGEIFEETYDCVIVGTGHFTYPKMASYTGMEKFQGKIMHTHSLKGMEMFKDKKVVVVGIGCSGLDAAVATSNVASQVYLSTRSGAWILPRVGPYGLPFDLFLIRRIFFMTQTFFKYKFTSWLLEKLYLNKRYNHDLYNIRPLHPLLAKDPVVNDLLPAKMLTGEIVMKKDIKYFTEKGVMFENEDKFTEADIVIMATGYTWKFPYLEEDDIIRTEGNRIDLYKSIFPTHLKHPSLAIIGFFLPLGPGFPIGEAQCRWVAQVFNGKFLPPNEEEMQADVIRHYKEISKRCPPSEKMTLRVDFIPYQDEICSKFGAKPILWKYFFTDFTLFCALLFGPSLPYQYRLQGPHKWDGAREAIVTVYDRVVFPLSGSECKKQEKLTTFKLGFFSEFILPFLLISFCLLNSEISTKYVILDLILLYIITLKGFFKKYFACLILLPFYFSSSVLGASCLLIIHAPVLIASLI